MVEKKKRTDGRGTVVVTVTLTNDNGETIKGNVRRSFKVASATVTQVAAAVERVFRRPDTYSLKE